MENVLTGQQNESRKSGRLKETPISIGTPENFILLKTVDLLPNFVTMSLNCLIINGYQANFSMRNQASYFLDIGDANATEGLRLPLLGDFCKT